MVRAIEFYSGIGGLHLALSRSQTPATVIAAYDWDPIASQVYTVNYGPNVIHKADISTLTAARLSHFQADLWLLSPACQPYTILNPDAKGASDPRARSFLHLIDNVLPQLAAQQVHPRYMLVENVAGFQDSDMRHHLVSTLKQLGYNVAEFNLTPLQFGIPNSRLRYYLLAKLSRLRFPGYDESRSNILDYIPSQCPEMSVAPRCLNQYLDELDDESLASFKVSDRVLEKWGRLFDIVLPSGTRSCCFTRGYTQLVERAGSILQMSEQLDTTRVFDEFFAAQRSGDEQAVRLLNCLRLRYFTPSELLRLFHITDPFTNTPCDFIWPPGVSLKSKYRLIGNSVNVEVVRRLINYLLIEESREVSSDFTPADHVAVEQSYQH
ncbi:S-adenosyl-L-methionine-dependent methyltransferase [Pisolithus sp. B1]|nr:S-adenosyl-L-methionine-dependent methyltransferase [Pisolithus sp. B1]